MLQRAIKLIIFYGELLRDFLIEQKKRILKDASKRTLETGDQRHIENALGGSDNNSNSSYDGMYERKRKERP